MMVCHCVETLALAVWVGGLVVIIAAVIPAVFNTIGMEAGGRMLTSMFRGYDRLALVAAGLLVTGTLARARWSSGPWTEQISMAELVLSGLMVGIVLILAFWLSPETTRLQALAFSASEEAKRASYEEFFAYHRAARALYVLNLGLGIALLCVKAGKWARQ